MAPRSLPPSLKHEEVSPSTKQHINRPFLLFFIYVHVAALYGLYLSFTTAKWETLIMTCVFHIAAMLGVTAGAHRLWSHRSYKANMPLQILLLSMFSLSFQYTVFRWVQYHRVHHKYSDTDADPHNSKRGFFYSHIGWAFLSESDLVRQKSLAVDMRDICSNPVLKFQKRYAGPLFLFFVLLNLGIPAMCWGESFSTAWYMFMLRFSLNTHAASLVNSAAHLLGNRPYDKNIGSVQNIPTSIFMFGEGFHNYHHTFPWDYKASELGNNILNVTTMFIDLFAWIGWAYDLKSVPDEIVQSRAGRTGDGTNLWGWGDTDMSDEMRNEALVSNKA